MTTREFFIDTADLEYIEKTWNKLAPFVSKEDFAGVTTNPSAIAKISVNTIEGMRTRVRKLCELTSKIRNDNLGVVYVQIPNSNMPVGEVEEYIKLVLDFSDGQTKVALKIPPYEKYLNMVEKFKDQIDFNVTGVADCATALMSFTYDVKFVSIIPGRMEERGVNASQQIEYVNKRSGRTGKIITGSMRTLDGLQRAIQLNTVPTIGTRVFDQIIINDEGIKNFVGMWDKQEGPETHLETKFSPNTNMEMTKLSVEFFQQMDDLGADLYKHFLVVNKLAKSL
jgi:transaldolase